MTPRGSSSKRSERLFARALAVLPGGVNSPVRAFKAVGGSPRFIARARGSRLEDVDGRSYIDYVMSWGPLIHGHAPPDLVKLLAAAARRGTSYGAPTEVEVLIGERVRAIMPALEMIRFTNSGTEATMSALRVARAATARDFVIKFAGCYHGHADGFLVEAGSGALTFGVPTSPGVAAATAGLTLTARFNDLRLGLEAVDRAPRQGGGCHHRTGCRQHGRGRARRRLPPRASAPVRRERRAPRVRRGHDGLPRAQGGAQASVPVRPDLTCLGKIIGGGLPVGAFGGRRDLMSLVAPAGPVYQAGTLSGNPLAVTGGPLVARAARRLALSASRATHRRGWPTGCVARRRVPASRCRSIASARWSRRSSRPRRSATIHGADAPTRRDTARFFQGLLARGIHPPASQFEAWFLSDAHTDRDIARQSRRREAHSKTRGDLTRLRRLGVGPNLSRFWQNAARPQLAGSEIRPAPIPPNLPRADPRPRR